MRLLFIASSLCLVAVALTHAPASAQRSLRVLFIGNSFTRFNDLPGMIRRLGEAATPPVAIEVAMTTQSGSTLRRHWQSRTTRLAVERGRYTHVVLQGHSRRPFDRPEELREYAQRFDGLIDRAGARTVLYSTWTRIRQRSDAAANSATEAQAQIDRFYAELARTLGGDVAPVGRAWQLAQARVPAAELYMPDGIHPRPAGTYLAACVLYATLTGESPRGIAWQPWPMRPAEAQRLQEIAAAAGSASR